MGKNGITVERLEVAARLRQIRNNAGLTQEKFAELLEISLSAYKKIESAENQITIDGLRKLERELNVSSDYILFGKNEDTEQTWKMVLNCSEPDKMRLLLRLLAYFSKAKKGTYILQNEQNKYENDILTILKELDM